ncbi:MAG: hypothetical protein ACREL7_15050 [Longimicrobiales bacterium]
MIPHDGTNAGAGVLHAKAVIVDEDAVFVTSANVTKARARSQHRDRTADSRPRDRVEHLGSLPGVDRPRAVEPAADGMKGDPWRTPHSSTVGGGDLDVVQTDRARTEVVVLRAAS